MDNQYCPYVSSILFHNKMMISCRKVLENVIHDFKKEGYIFNHIVEMNIITIAKKWICHMISLSYILCKLLNGNYSLRLTKTKV